MPQKRKPLSWAEVAELAYGRALTWVTLSLAERKQGSGCTCLLTSSSRTPALTVQVAVHLGP